MDWNCTNGAESSDWDHDNDGIPDEDDKIPTRITSPVPPDLWLDSRFPAKFNGSVDWLDPEQGMSMPAPNVPCSGNNRMDLKWYASH